MRWVWCLGVGAIACARLGEDRPYPLYETGPTRPMPAQLATLHGPIAAVDGQKVTGKGKTFALLPGCHIVTLQRNVGAADSNANGAWAGTLPPLAVAFKMRPAHTYLVNVRFEETSGPYGHMRIDARERDPQGQTSPVPWIRSNADIDECRRWGERKEF